MKRCPWFTCRHLLILVSIMFLNLPNGIPWLYGNLITYLNSYIFQRHGPAGFDIDPTWPLSLFSITYNIGMAAPGLMIKYMGLRVTTLVCIILTNMAFFLSYFTSQISIGYLSITLGVLSGISVGAIASVSLYYMCAWFPNHVGRACAFSSCSSGGGSIFSNAVITTYVNPNNLKPNIVDHTRIYFSQPDLLDRVPAVFLVFGIISLGMHSLGWLLLQSPPDDDEHVKESCNGHTLQTVSEVSKDSHDLRLPLAHCGHQLYTVDSKDKETLVNNISSERCVDYIEDKETISDKRDASNSNNIDKSPRDILHMKSFYVLWFSVGTLMYGLIMESNYYKQFGQTLLKDDNYFVIVGSIYSIGSVGGRLLAGYVLDKIGLKKTLIIYMALNTILFIIWYHSLYLNPVIYAIVSIAITVETTAAFVIASFAAVTLYGKSYFSVNTGLIFSSIVVGSLLISFLSAHILDLFGWFWLFQTETLLSIIMLIIVMIFLPEMKPQNSV